MTLFVVPRILHCSFCDTNEVICALMCCFVYTVYCFFVTIKFLFVFERILHLKNFTVAHFVPFCRSHEKLKPQEYNCIAGQFRFLATNTTSPGTKDSHGKNDYLIGDNIMPETIKTLSMHMDHLDLPLD